MKELFFETRATALTSPNAPWELDVSINLNSFSLGRVLANKCVFSACPAPWVGISCLPAEGWDVCGATAVLSSQTALASSHVYLSHHSASSETDTCCQRISGPDYPRAAQPHGT